MGEQEEAQPHLRYSMTIEWSDEDQLYIATVPELPGCRTHGKTYAEAVQQGYYAMEGWVEAAIAWSHPVPEPKLFVYRWWNDDGTLGEPEAEDVAEAGELAQQRG
jgi:predicted RNase H-like HicB family nuclease